MTAANTHRTPPAPSPSGGQTVALRMDFYRDGFRWMLVSYPVLVIALLASILLNAYMLKHQPEPRYFVTDPAGRIAPVAPLNIPYISPQSLLNWVSEAATGAYTFDAENYRKQLQEMSKHFTAQGHEDYLASMKPTVEFVIKGTMIASAVPTGAPVIVGEGETPQGVYAWKIRMPIQAEYRSAKERAKKALMLTIVVVRRSTIENPFGIGISQLIAREI